MKARLEERLQSIEEMLAMLAVKVNALELAPLREALSKCSTPEECKEILDKYNEVTRGKAL